MKTNLVTNWHPNEDRFGGKLAPPSLKPLFTLELKYSPIIYRVIFSIKWKPIRPVKLKVHAKVEVRMRLFRPGDHQPISGLKGQDVISFGRPI